MHIDISQLRTSESITNNLVIPSHILGRHTGKKVANEYKDLSRYYKPSLFLVTGLSRLSLKIRSSKTGGNYRVNELDYSAHDFP